MNESEWYGISFLLIALQIEWALSFALVLALHPRQFWSMSGVVDPYNMGPNVMKFLGWNVTDTKRFHQTSSFIFKKERKEKEKFDVIKKTKLCILRVRELYIVHPGSFFQKYCKISFLTTVHGKTCDISPRGVKYHKNVVALKILKLIPKCTWAFEMKMAGGRRMRLEFWHRSKTLVYGKRAFTFSFSSIIF